jgi:hypothetical protein
VAKRIEFIVRNPGFEGTENALGILSLDFESDEAFTTALATIKSQLFFTNRVPVTLVNEKGDQLGFNAAYYVNHRISEVEEWRAAWFLAVEGAPPPTRES